MYITPGYHAAPELGITCDSATLGKTGAVFIKTQYEITEGEFKGRKIWGLIGLHSPKGETFKEMGREFICSVLESARGILPSDKSHEAKIKRSMQSYEELDYIEFVALIGVKADQNGEDRNEIKRALTPDDARYKAVMGTLSTETKPTLDELFDDALPF